MVSTLNARIMGAIPNDVDIEKSRYRYYLHYSFTCRRYYGEKKGTA